MSVYITYSLAFESNDSDKALGTIQNGLRRFVERLPFLSGEIACSSRPSHKLNQIEVRPLSPGHTEEESSMIQIRHHSRSMPLTGFATGCSLGIESSITSILEDGFYRYPFVHLGEFKPLLRLQANNLLDGIILCMNFNHTAFDGVGMGQIVEALATCCRAKENEPFNFRTSLENEAAARKAIFQSAHIPQPTVDVSPAYGVSEESIEETDEDKTGELTSVNIYLSADKLQWLKEACNRDLKRMQAAKPGSLFVAFLSTQDVLNALIWLCIMQQSPDEEVSLLGIPISVRKRIQPAIADSYMGSAILFNPVHFVRADIPPELPSIDATASSLPASYITLLTRIASMARQSLQAVDAQYTGRVVSKVCNARDWSQVVFQPPELSISTILHTLLYEYNFGEGLGMLMSFDLPRMPYNRMFYVKPRRDLRFQKSSNVDAAPFEINMSINARELELLENNQLVRWAAIGALGTSARAQL